MKDLINKILTKIKSFNKKQILIIAGISLSVIILVAAGIYYFVIYEKPVTGLMVEDDVLEEPREQCQSQRQLDGVCVESGQENLLPFTIMIDNNVGARPPLGLSQANLVYEAIAEGSITRFLAIYDSALEIDKIGPVRSARPYYVDWAEEFEGIYAHVGGSEAGLAQLHSANVYNLDQFYQDQYFWRDYRRIAPHNVFTSTKLLNQAIENNSWDQTAEFDSWLYKDEQSLEEQENTAEIIKFDFGSPAHQVRWEYNEEDNAYQRFQANVKHQDLDGTQIMAKNIAVMYTKSIPIDDYGRRSTTTIGSGPAAVFLDGQVIKGAWKRPDRESRTRFYTDQGEEVTFNPGITWIEVVPIHFPEVEYSTRTLAD
jgi:hypothetical protein